jgi:hypothetical protein
MVRGKGIFAVVTVVLVLTAFLVFQASQAEAWDPALNAKNAKALSAGGGEPGKAFMAYKKDLAKKDFKAAQKRFTKKFEGPAEQLQMRLEIDADTMPPDAKITKGFVKGDTAELHVAGTLDAQKTYGVIEMLKEDGQWCVAREKWSDKPVE